jgi:hypothetical protein
MDKTLWNELNDLQAENANGGQDNFGSYTSSVAQQTYFPKPSFARSGRPRQGYDGFFTNPALEPYNPGTGGNPPGNHFD